jgi:hypothetical protein
VLVNGRMPNTRHGHEDASKMTSTGGPNWFAQDRTHDTVPLPDFLEIKLFIPFVDSFGSLLCSLQMTSIQRDPSKNINESIVMNNLGMIRISFPDSVFSEGFHRNDSWMGNWCLTSLAWHCSEVNGAKTDLTATYTRRGSNVINAGGTIERTAFFGSNSHGTCLIAYSCFNFAFPEICEGSSGRSPKNSSWPPWKNSSGWTYPVWE